MQATDGDGDADEGTVMGDAFEKDDEIDLHRAELLLTANKALEAVFEKLPGSAIQKLAEEKRALESELERPGRRSAIPRKTVALSWFAKALEFPAFLVSLLDKDPLAEARMRGVLARKQLLQAEGGLVTAPELGEQLNVSRQTIHQRLQRRELFAIGEGDRKYPAWQAHGDKTLPGLAETLAALDEDDGMTTLVFFLTPDSQLDGKTPLEVLRRGEPQDVARVVAAARRYGEHGAR